MAYIGWCIVGVPYIEFALLTIGDVGDKWFSFFDPSFKRLLQDFLALAGVRLPYSYKKRAELLNMKDFGNCWIIYL